jgi:hypothetical protein
MGKRTVINDENEIKYTKGKIDVAEGRVGCRFGFTKNLGDYNSLVIQFWEDDDVQDGENSDEASERLYRNLEKRIEAVVEEYQFD